MSKSRFDEILSKEIRGAKTPSVEDAVAMLTGKDKRSIPKPVKKRTGKKRMKRNAVDVGGSEEVDTIDHLDHINEIPAGFPEGTILNDDGTLTLPDGRMIRKKQEVDHG